MAGPLQVTLPESELGERLAEHVGTAAPFLVAASATGLIAADHGGYWPTSWGWSALALAWVGGLALVLREGRVSRLELGWIGGLAALTGWTALSWLWTSSGTQTALEIERTLVYLLAAVAVTAIARSAAYRGLLWGAWAGSTAACLYALATRLFPERLGVTDSIAGYRLFAPIGYWNGLGLLAAVAVLLALGLATDGRHLPARAAPAASLPLLAPTLYFTFSRGAWIALAGGLLAAAALSHRRTTLASSFLVLALPVAAAVWLAYRAKPLRQTDASLAQAVQSGHALAWQLLAVAAASAGLALAYGILARRLRVPPGFRLGFGALLGAAFIGGCALLVVHYGGPGGLVRHARNSIDSSGPAQQGSDLSSRLFSLSSNGRLRQWHVALDEWHAHPLLGGGAGTYAQYWAAAGPNQGQLLDVHNLYLETLAELGPVGLAILAAVLLAPLAAAVRARRRTLVPIAAGAYVAWLVHVTYDWDWELPGVTIAALVCAGAILAAARSQGTAWRQAPVRWGLLAVVVISGALALFGLLGNRALTQSGNALRDGNFQAAVSAAENARQWAPWSSQPWAQLAAIRMIQGDRRAELAAYRQAVTKDPSNWQLWLGLLTVSTGPERARALDRLTVLSPAAAAGARGTP
jgi:cytochrome c-type biogenesis protein CcmH/NrfG